MDDDLKIIADLLARAQLALLGYRQRLLRRRDTEAPARDTPPAEDVARDTKKGGGDAKRDTPSVLDQPIWPADPETPTEDSP